LGTLRSGAELLVTFHGLWLVQSFVDVQCSSQEVVSTASNSWCCSDKEQTCFTNLNPKQG